MPGRALAPLLVFVVCTAGHVFADEVVDGRFGPGALYSLAVRRPGIDIPTAIVGPAIVAMQSNPGGALAISSIDQTPVPFSNPVDLGESIVTALAGHAGSFNDLAPAVRGKPYFENQGVP